MAKYLARIGSFIGVAGLIILIHELLAMYNLAANCPNGYDGCSAYSTWHSLNILGAALLVIGALIVLGCFITQKYK